MDDNNFSGYFNGRFGDRSNTDSDDDGFGDDSLPPFLTKALEQQESQSNSTPKSSNHSIVEISDGSYKADAILRSIDSAFLVFGQFHSPLQIAELFIKRPGPSADSIAERSISLLYNEDEIIHAMQKFAKLRYKRKDYQPSPLELFVLLFLHTHYPRASDDIITRFHQFFWGGSSIENFYRFFTDIRKHDPSSIIQSFAAFLESVENDYLHHDFQYSDLENANVTQETFTWWQNSIMSQERVEECEAPPNPAPINENISELESIVHYLDQEENDSNVLATLNWFGHVIELQLKSTVIGDRDPDVDINLTSVDGFQIDEKSEILCLIMLKNDLRFYLENLKEKSVFVNGYEIKQNQATYLLDQSLIEIGNLPFLFCINQGFMTRLEKVMNPVI